MVVLFTWSRPADLPACVCLCPGVALTLCACSSSNKQVCRQLHVHRLRCQEFWIPAVPVQQFCALLIGSCRPCWLYLALCCTNPVYAASRTCCRNPVHTSATPMAAADSLTCTDCTYKPVGEPVHACCVRLVGTCKTSCS